MKNLIVHLRCTLCAIFFFCTANLLFAQIPLSGKSNASPAEIEKAKEAVEANPDSQRAHRSYLFAMGLSNPLIVPQYEAWMKKYPDDVNIPLAIGTVYYNAEMPQPKDFLLKASEMQPQNGKIWTMLAADANMKGENELSIEYLKKAASADPSNANYSFAYLITFLHGDPLIFKEKVLDFVQRFPTSERGSQALYLLAEGTKNINEKISYLEELRKLYPPQKFKWSAPGMVLLADAYLQTDPGKALPVINEMGDEKDWGLRKNTAELLIQTSRSEQEGNYKEAIAELNQVKLPEYNSLESFLLLKKASLLEKSGNIQAAYDSVAAKFAKLPTDQLDTALLAFGKKLGKNREQVSKDIETIRADRAIAAYPFELGLYTSDSKLSLRDLKGKVVLLTFWFPGCGPCGEEFPHFQAVIDQFKGRPVTYIGINVTPLEDAYVLPFLKNNKYSFIPLHGDREFAFKNFGVNGEPENFLIDKDGKIIFKDFRIDGTNHRALEMMISSLLQKESKAE